MNKTRGFNCICSPTAKWDPSSIRYRPDEISSADISSCRRPRIARRYAICASLLAALTLSACGSSQTAQVDTPVATPKAAPARVASALPKTAPARMEEPAAQNAQAPSPRTQKQIAATEPAPRTAGTVIETVTVTEEPVSTVETTEIVETAEGIVERKETVETTERVIDRVEVDEQQGRVTETVDIVESTEKTVDVLAVDKRTGAAAETIVRSAPVEKETGHMTVVVQALKGPKDPSRRFTGPDGIEVLTLAGFGIVAVKADTPASDRQRLVMICEAFASPTPDLERRDGADPGMVTVWPISSTAHAEELNAAAHSPDCAEAVERYGLSEGERAIADAERSGWILEDRGPYLLAWSPPMARGAEGAPVLLADLSGVTTPEAARAIMHRWSGDVETNAALWNEARWNAEHLQAVMERWRVEFGPRVLLLLGPAGG